MRKRPENLSDLVRLTQQAGAGAAAGDAAHGAAHVDVNHVGVVGPQLERGLQQALRVVIEELESDGALGFKEGEALVQVGMRVEHILGVDEFGIADGRAEPARQRTERLVREAVHGREDDPAVDGDGADVE